VIFLFLTAFILATFFTSFVRNLFAFWVSIHEEIDHYIPFFVTRDVVSELKGLPSKKPEHVCNGVAGLVVRWDGYINPVEGRVGITKRNNWDVHVRCLSKTLMIKARITDNHKSWL
jgi:hypothetical protein